MNREQEIKLIFWQSCMFLSIYQLFSSWINNFTEDSAQGSLKLPTLLKLEKITFSVQELMQFKEIELQRIVIFAVCVNFIYNMQPNNEAINT